MFMQRLRARLRQWTFPASFRIAPGGGGDWAGALVDAVIEARKAAESVRETAPPADAETGASAGLDPDFLVPLCNDLFRLQRNVCQLQTEGNDSKEVRSIGRALESLEEFLKEHSVECLDLTGQAYDDGRTDFEPIGAPEEVPGLEGKKISVCERPYIAFHGKVIQRARGIVAIPARGPKL